jgi:hypothetical protein
MQSEEVAVLDTKVHNEDDIQIIEKTNPLSLQFDDGLYSDFVVFVRTTSYRLHKVILSQSPFLKKYLESDSVVLDCEPVGLQICLQDLYYHPRASIQNDNVFQVLDVACYLELQELAYFCYTFILDKLTKLESIHVFCSQLQQGGPNISQKYKEKLHQAVLGTLLYCCSLCSMDEPDRMEDRVYPPGPMTPMCLFLAQLPLVWIERIVKSDLLTIPCEFERYQLVKSILRLRQSRPVQVTVESSSEEEEEEEKVEAKQTVVSGVAKKVYSLLDNWIPKAKKRKLEESDDETVSSPVSEQRIIKPLPNRPTLPQTISSMYESGIVYTYMTFPQLGIVKKDEIVPLHLALESYWLQAELGTNEAGKNLPPFRFGCCFEKVSAFFKDPGNTLMTSDSVVCAGIQYRLLLAKDNDKDEIKALLQKSKGKGPSVAYSIYAFDSRTNLDKHQVIHLVKPITTVKNGEGFANPLPSVAFKTETDRIWLTCCVHFE